MEKLMTFIKKPMGMMCLAGIASIIVIVVLIKLLMPSSVKTAANKLQNAITAPVNSNVRYTTEETLNTLTGEVENQGKTMETLEKHFNVVQKSNQKGQQVIKGTMNKELGKMDKENQRLKQTVAEEITALKTVSKKVSHQANADGYILGQGGQGNDGMVWVADTSASARHKPGTANADSLSVLHAQEAHTNMGEQAEEEPKTIPMFTIPENTWLTQVTPLQPLVGIIPVDGQVMDPRTVSFVVSKNNLAANHWRLPEAIQGIQGNAVCQGFFNISRSSVTCKVTSLTFIFQDGRIATAKAENGKSLGVITDNHGNPQVAGTWQSNMGFILGGSSIFAGIQGWGNALSQAQMFTQNAMGSNGPTSVSKVTGSANKYAIGQAIGSMGETANSIWASKLNNALDYVVVPNWNPQTHKLLQLNIIINQEIPIDYNKENRKVYYANANQKIRNNSLD